MLMIGWISFIISWCFNLLFYKLHPSSVDFDKGRFRAARGFIHIRGRKKIIMAPKEKNTDQVRKKYISLRCFIVFRSLTPSPKMIAWSAWTQRRRIRGTRWGTHSRGPPLLR